MCNLRTNGFIFVMSLKIFLASSTDFGNFSSILTGFISISVQIYDFFWMMQVVGKNLALRGQKKYKA